MPNLLFLYEVYLLATLLLGLVQIRNHLQLVRFVLSVPGRWPHILRIARGNLHVILTWPVLIVGATLLGIWTASVLVRNLVFPAAHVEPAQLVSNVPAMIVVALAAPTMVGLDLRASFNAARFQAPRYGWLLDLTEAGLAAETGGGPLSLLVGWKAKRLLVRQARFLHQWLWRRALEITNRLIVGVALWSAWASL